MKTAVKVVDPRLRADFGFRHIMWVFSGRRGIHCWVADAAARALDAAARGTVLDYLTATGGGDEQVRKCQLPARVHPALQEAYNNVLLPFFVDEYMEDQELLTHPDRYVLRQSRLRTMCVLLLLLCVLLFALLFYVVIRKCWS
jgi:DNA primase small subunit